MMLKSTLFLLFLGCAVPVAAQFDNILLTGPDAKDSYASEPSVVIDPRHPENIAVALRPNNVYYTKDAGKSWAQTTLASAFGVTGNPVLISDPKGGFYCFHLSDPAASEGESLDRIVVQQSGDGGMTWTAGGTVGFNHPKEQHRESATTDSRGNLYVTWTQFDKFGDADPGCVSNILFSMSKNGKKWSEPVVISQRAGDCTDGENTVRGSMPAVTLDGKAMVAWSHKQKIWLDRSFNGGDLWLSNDIEVADQTGGSKLSIPGHGPSSQMPVLMTDQSKSRFRGSLYVVWADQRNGESDTDIWFTRSHNFGDNWSPPARVNDDGEGSHQYLPSMTVDQETGFLYVVYYDRRNYDDVRTDVYLAFSTDGGASFKNVLISQKPFTPDPGEAPVKYNHISAQRGIIVPVWTRMDDGKTSVWTSIIAHEDLEKASASVE